MKKKSPIPLAPGRRSLGEGGFFSPRVLIVLLVSIATCSIVTGTLPAFFRPQARGTASQRTLSFEERVSYQRAIEGVYWRHRIWPKENAYSKPSLDAVMSQAQLEKKVTDYLRKSQVLVAYWQRPITAEQLQAEMDRMAKHTKQPEVLRELFEALGNDPFVIAECLARPTLAERLFHAAEHSQDANGGAIQVIDSHNADGKQFAAYILPVIATSLNTADTCVDDTWTATNTNESPSAREYHTAVWTGSEMIVWGGYDGTGNLNTGGRFNPSTDSWTTTTTINAPSARSGHTAVWTGNEVIVWGGVGDFGELDTGGRYNPDTNSWSPVSTNNAPFRRQAHTAVWTGSEMIIWGGFIAGGAMNTGGRYRPDTNSWTTTSATNAPDHRYFHTAVWTGSEMIIWGGRDASGDYFNTGGKYNPSANTWVGTGINNAPFPRDSHTAIWTGSEMIVWGGYDGFNLSSGGKYDPAMNSWTTTSTINTPEARYYHKAVWTGSEMIIWGGWDGITLGSGGRYNRSTDTWRTTGITSAPSARDLHTAVWTGSEMIVWGGTSDGIGTVLNTGSRYCAQAGPTPTPCTGRCSPTPRPRPTPHTRPTP